MFGKYDINLDVTHVLVLSFISIYRKILKRLLLIPYLSQFIKLLNLEIM